MVEHTALRLVRARELLADFRHVHVEHHERKLDPESRALVFSGTAGRHAPSVQLDEALHDGESQAQAAMMPGRRGVCLPEALEHVRQELRRYALPGVDHAQLEM